MTGGQASGFLEHIPESPLDRPKHKNDVTNTNQQNIEGRKTTRRVYQGDGQGEENPADDIVANTGSENDKADNIVQQLQLCEDTAEHWESGDSDGNSNEEDKVAEIDRVRDESVVERYGDRRAKTEGYNESQSRNKEGGFGVPFHKSDIDLEANEEQEQCDTDAAGKSEKGKGVLWEDRLAEIGNTTHD